MSSSPTEFHGQLVFQACRARDASAEKILGDLVKSQPFSDVEYPSIGRTGFERLPFDSINQDCDERALALCGQSTGARFRKESLGEETEVYDPGQSQRITAHPISEKTADLLTTTPETVLVRGSMPTYQQVFEEIQAAEPAGGRLSEISFDSDFMLWLFWQYSTGQSISDLSPISLTSAELSGQRDMFGKSAQVSESIDLSSSPAILLGLLTGQHFQSISGKFEYHGEFIEMDISQQGRIHVKTTGQLVGLSMPERVLLASDAVNKTVKTYSQWANRPPSSKYPPAEFFSNMLERLSDQDVEVRFSTDQIFKKYAEKRAEDFEEYTRTIRDV